MWASNTPGFHSSRGNRQLDTMVLLVRKVRAPLPERRGEGKQIPMIFWSCARHGPTSHRALLYRNNQKGETRRFMGKLSATLRS